MKSEPIPAVDYEVEVRKVWPDAICVLVFHSSYRVKSELNDEWKNLSSFFATPAEAWADAYSKLPQPTAVPSSGGEGKEIQCETCGVTDCCINHFPTMGDGGWTKGPWITIENHTNTSIATGRYENGGAQVAFVAGNPNKPYRRANANLIAAAPELHDALDRIRKNVRNMFRQRPVRDWEETLAEADAAILKARGGAK